MSCSSPFTGRRTWLYKGFSLPDEHKYQLACVKLYIKQKRIMICKTIVIKLPWSANSLSVCGLIDNCISDPVDTVTIVVKSENTTSTCVRILVHAYVYYIFVYLLLINPKSRKHSKRVMRKTVFGVSDWV